MFLPLVLNAARESQRRVEHERINLLFRTLAPLSLSLSSSLSSFPRSLIEKLHFRFVRDRSLIVVERVDGLFDIQLTALLEKEGNKETCSICALRSLDRYRRKTEKR